MVESISKVMYIGEKIAFPYSLIHITPNFKLAGL